MLKTENFETPPFAPYIAVDTIPEIALARQEVRDSAWAMVHQREADVLAGNEVFIPLEIDALSTAEAALEARDSYGADSPDYLEKWSGLVLDCTRLVAEWHRKLKPEYFPPSRHFFDAETGDFFSHGLSIRQMTENALRPIDNNPEEVERRVNERVENETPAIIKKVGCVALEAYGIRTFSECTQKAIDDFNEDDGVRHTGYDGYVPEIEKVMIRDIRFDAETGDRLEEQLGLPGTVYNSFIIREALRRRQVEARHMDKTELHGTQILVQDDLVEDFLPLLDEVASQEWCMNIFMGEEVAEDFVKDYTVIRQQAAERQAGLKDTAETVATFIMDLAEDGFDKRAAPAHVESFVKKLLLTMAKDNIELAPQMFDPKTTAGLALVKYYENVGDMESAYNLFQMVEEQAPGGGYCSGGSCGLKNVDLHTKEGKELAEKLHAEPGDTVVRDTERKCKCGKKTIVYAYNSKKVHKYCESCHAVEFRKTESKAA